MELRSRGGEKGRVVFYFGQKATAEFTEEDIQEIFDNVFIKQGVVFKPYIGNTESKLYHAWDCNHLPPEGLKREFETEGEAKAAGYRACPICFSRGCRVTHYSLERQLGIEMASLLRSYYPPSEDQEARNRFESAGLEVLNNWPLPLKGYNYRFDLLESEVARSFACPTGFVFITTGLLYALESEGELEAVIAHEVAHIEGRHGYWALRKGINPVQFDELLGETYSEKVDRFRLSRFSDLFYSVARSCLIMGYGPKQEKEADYYACLYLAQRYGTEPLSSVLKKLQYLQELEPDFSANMFMTDPYIDLRIENLENTKVRLFEETLSFKGFNKKGEDLIDVRFLGQCLTGDTLRLFLYMAPTVNFKGSFSLSPKDRYAERVKLVIYNDKGRMEFISDQEEEIKYGYNQSALFRNEKAEGFLTDEIQKIELNIPGVARWEGKD